MTGNRETGRYVLCLVHYYEYEFAATYAYYIRRICRTDVTEQQLQFICDKIEEKRLQLRAQINHLMNF